MKLQKNAIIKLFFSFIVFVLFVAADPMLADASDSTTSVILGEEAMPEVTSGDDIADSSTNARTAAIPDDTGALPGADPEYVFDQDKRMENGEIVQIGDIEVVYEDGTPVEDGVKFNLFNMTVMRNESEIYTTKDGKLSGIKMIAGKEYKIGFDVSNEYWKTLEVVGAYNSKKLIRIYARYENCPPLYYDYFEGIDGEEIAVPKIVIRKLGEDETAVQTRPTSCIMSLIVAHDGYYADAGAPFRIVCKDNGKGKTVISDEGALTFTADANLHYEIVLSDNPTYKMKDKIDFIIQMDSKGRYWAIFEGTDVEDASSRLTYIDLERIDGKTDANEGKTKIDDLWCGGTDEETGEGSECTPQEYAYIYDAEKVTLSGMKVCEASGEDCYTENAVPISKAIKFVFYNSSKQVFEITVTSENGTLPDVELYKGHSYIVYAEDSEYEMPNYYISLSESGEQPTCTKCYGKEDGFYLYKRAAVVDDPAKENRVAVTLPVQIKKGNDLILKPGIKVKLISVLETIELTSDENGYISAELIEDINYMVQVEDDEYSVESFPMTIKDKSEYGAGKYPYDHTSCGGVNGIYLCEKGTEHDRDTTLVCPSKKTTVTGLNFNGGRYVLQGRILENETVAGMEGKEYDVLDVDVINMYRTELSKLAAGEFTITRELEEGRKVKNVYYIDDEGKLQEVPFEQKDNTVTYKMNSLSVYNNVIEYDNTRIYGKDRYATSFKIANAYKAQLGIDKFENIIVACGTEFADALAGSYLASVKNAPILMVNEKDLDTLATYIAENLEKDGMIYILGGNNAVSDSVQKKLKECGSVKRLGGKTRFETNLLILEEAGVTNQDIIVCTATEFADSLSASALGRPILLVGDSLAENQKAYLSGLKESNKYYIIGGTSAVASVVENEVKAYGETVRIGGKTRYETSVLVAEKFFEDPEEMILAYAKNFPDGLSGGPLAMSKKAPLILTATGEEEAAVAYAQKENITKGAVLGGSILISDEVMNKIFIAD